MVHIIHFDTRFRDTWLVKDFGKIISKYIRENDSILFMCAGKFRYRSLLSVDCYYLDIEPKVISDVDREHKYFYDVTDYKLVEKINRKFDIVVLDPPYYIPYHKRIRTLKNAAALANRVVIVKWNFIPRLGENWELKDLYIYESKRWWTYASIITVFTRKHAND